MTPGKRVFDLAVLALLGTILGPVLVALAICIAVKQGRPILFGSQRCSGPDRIFTLWKLRSMTQDAADSGVSGGDKQQRITPIGRILRRSRMDELPQMWNILKGDISFVGPRPPLPIYVARFPALYAQVLQSRPGVTGLASLVFAAHEEAILARCATFAETDAAYVRRCIPRKARIDLIYQRRRSLLLDLWIVVITGGRALGLMKRGPRLPRLPRLDRPKRQTTQSCGRMPTNASVDKSSVGGKARQRLDISMKDQGRKVQ